VLGYFAAFYSDSMTVESAGYERSMKTGAGWAAEADFAQVH